MYQSIECLTNCNSESHTDSTPSQSNNKILNKALSKTKEKPIPEEPSTPRLPLYKKAKEFVTNKKQAIKVNDKPSNQKQNSNTVRSATFHNNPAIKVKTITSTNKLKKNKFVS